MDIPITENSLSKTQELEVEEDSNPNDEQLPKHIPSATKISSVSNPTDQTRSLSDISKRKGCGRGHGTITESSSHDPVITIKQYLNILQSMGQSLHIIDLNGLVIYWNQAAEHLYGYSASEVLGRHIKDIMLDAANEINRRNKSGENWTGLFPGRNKQGRLLQFLSTNTPFYDDRGTLVGFLCVSSDSHPFRENIVVPVSFSENPSKSDSYPSSSWLHRTGLKTTSPDCDSQHKPLQDIVSSITSKPVSFDPLMATGKPAKTGINLITPRVKGIFWQQKSQQKQVVETNLLGGNEASNSLFYTFDSERTSSLGICGTSSSLTSCSRHKFYMEADSSSYDIPWGDLTFGKQIGRGSYATVYSGLWHGSDVAIKLFFNLDYSEDLLRSFREEVSLMKRLRHPNVVLFMGEVTSPEYLCIVTEFLPRGNLFQLLRHHTPTLDWKRRVQMALDIARGMNYLHYRNPPIVHRDLKSSNLLVDKNWTVKVGDFGLSRLKHATFLTTKTWKGTPQWMAPEVIRNEPADEKSDVYSFGVILWELATAKIPWDGLNQMQVVAAVGFMDKRNEIPKDIDPHWASLIESSWNSDPKCRPTFKELLERLKDLQRRYLVSKPKRIPC
ncbi:dual specificity protein kinase shkB-like [Papaver somniferum]|uniref:dual specificity protein kinase shkB-like n=1 Tax=Papaver somniferum TaxID=3469 RepID=UPI000E700312|nr:dual specificity protein kinase shkB-like [Papaver somniferum]